MGWGQEGQMGVEVVGGGHEGQWQGTGSGGQEGQMTGEEGAMGQGGTDGSCWWLGVTGEQHGHFKMGAARGQIMGLGVVEGQTEAARAR